MHIILFISFNINRYCFSFNNIAALYILANPFTSHMKSLVPSSFYIDEVIGFIEVVICIREQDLDF